MNHETTSDTPETDKSVRTFQAWDVPSGRHVMVEYVFVHTAKRLERERDRMQALAEVNGNLAHANACEAMDYRRERDEARSGLQVETWRADAGWQRADQSEAERDEARNALKPGGMLDIIDRAAHDRAAAIRERDEAIRIIEQIEERYVDGCDTYEDWKFMGGLARNFLFPENEKCAGTDASEKTL